MAEKCFLKVPDDSFAFHADVPDDCIKRRVYPGVQNSVEIALSPTVSETKAFLRFTQKFKMAAKNSG